MVTCINTYERKERKERNNKNNNLKNKFITPTKKLINFI